MDRMRSFAGNGINELPVIINDGDDFRYSFRRAITEDELLHIAASVLAEKLRTMDVINSPNLAKDLLRFRLGKCEREVFACLWLDARHQVIEYQELFFGTIDGAAVHPREVVKSALRFNAAAVIAAHCHPSGNPEPSHADVQMTRRLKDALALVDIRLLDHIVVTAIETVSFSERGML